MPFLRLVSFSLVLFLVAGQGSSPNQPPPGRVYLPLQMQEHTADWAPLVELRGLWVTRFDWTTAAGPANPARIDEIVAQAAAAGFNAIFFQVRGIADAYYQPGLEPWAARVSGAVLGQPPDPWWDPLAYFVQRAHAAGLQLHAYINLYPVAPGAGQCQVEPGPAVAPMPLYQQLIAWHGAPGGAPAALEWSSGGQVVCGAYRYASPASKYAEDHYVRLALDLARRYDIDGLHLDHVRYSQRNASCDPVSLCRYHGLPEGCQPLPACVLDAAYADWQRQLVSDTVRRMYDKLTALRPDLWLTAAVWPVHTNHPALHLPGSPREGYHEYYQDSKAWVQSGAIDAILPMIYPASFTCPDSSYWSQAVWESLVADFQADRGERFVIPGIGGGYCSFDEIAARIEKARELGVAGHAIFSYSGLRAWGYFDDLAAGPYARPATPPELPWR